MDFAKTYRVLVPVPARSWIRRNILPIKYQEIHIERILQTYRKICGWISKHPETMLMLTFTYDEPSKKLLETYERLISSFKNPIGLHVHISGGLYSNPLPLPNYDMQLKIINRGLNALQSLGVKTKDFCSGNWNYDEYTFLACKELGLTNVHIKVREIPKITMKYGLPKGISLIPVVSHLHDYDI